jgi:hypothetical protein
MVITEHSKHRLTNGNCSPPDGTLRHLTSFVRSAVDGLAACGGYFFTLRHVRSTMRLCESIRNDTMYAIFKIITHRLCFGTALIFTDY